MTYHLPLTTYILPHTTNQFPHTGGSVYTCILDVDGSKQKFAIKVASEQAYGISTLANEWRIYKQHIQANNLCHPSIARWRGTVMVAQGTRHLLLQLYISSW